MKKVVLLFLFLLISLTGFSQTAVHPAGAGTEEEPFLIASLENLYWITQNSDMWDAYYKQTSDIDATDTKTWDDGDGGAAEGFSPIGKYAILPAFTGSYDGDGHRIFNLTINRPSEDRVGFFGYTAPYAIIKQLGLVNASVIGEDMVGIIVGHNTNSKIHECFTSGNVSGIVDVGGILGYNENGTLNNSYSSANVLGTAHVGGVCGTNESHYLENTFAIGQVSGTADLGGVVGVNLPSSGLIINSFWDILTSGQSSSAGGTGKTSAEMKDVATFTNELTYGLSNTWDFYFNPYDDQEQEDIWHIDDSTKGGYPFLTWENSNTITICECDLTPQHFMNAGTTIQIESCQDDITIFHLKTQSTPSVQGSLPEGIIYLAPRYWTSEITCGCDLTNYFDYSIAFDVTGLSGINNFENLTVLYRENSSSEWIDLKDFHTAVLDFTHAPDSIRVFSLNTANVPLNGEFTIGGGSDNPLPVALNDFSGITSENGVKLSWQTETELDNLGFIISRNGEQIASYSSSTALKGQGTTSQRHSYKYIDYTAVTGKSYTYQLKSVDVSGQTHTYDPLVTISTVPEEVCTLEQNYPNPFNPSTTIQFFVPQASKVDLKIYDMLGKMIVNKTMNAKKGTNAYTFNGKDLSSGVYFYRLIAGNFVETKKMMLLK